MADARSRLSAELINDPAAIVEIEDSWRALAEFRGNAFISPEWFRAWSENRPDATSPLIVAVRHPEGGLAGVLPLSFDFSRRPRMISFPAATFGDRFGPAARQADEVAVAIAAMRAISEAGLDRYTLVLNNIEAGAAWWHAIQRSGNSNRAGIIQQHAEQPYISLAGLDWEGYLATRSASFRKKLRQRERKLEQERDVRVRSADKDSLEADLRLCFDLHERRWQTKSTILSPTARGFLGSFAAAALRRDWLRLRLLEIDGAPVAAFLGWRVGDRYAFYNSGFDPEWAELSVGTVLLSRTVQSAIQEGATEFDMLLGDESYKRRFQTDSRYTQTIVLPKAMAPARLLISARARAWHIGRRFARRRGARALRRLIPTSRHF